MKKDLFRKILITLLITFPFVLGTNTFAEDQLCPIPEAKEHFKNAVKFSIQGKIDLAMKEYNTAIQIDPNYAQAYNNIGYMYQQKGKIDQAMEYYKKTIELRPLDDTAHSNLASMYACKNQYDLAIAEYYKALNIDPGSITVELALEKVIIKKATTEGKTVEQIKSELAATYTKKDDTKKDSTEKKVDIKTEKPVIETKTETSINTLDLEKSIKEQLNNLKTISPSAKKDSEPEKEQIKLKPAIETDNKVDPAQKNEIEKLLKDNRVGALMILYKS